MFLDLDTELLFGNRTQALASIPSRDIRSKDQKSNTIYINTKFEHMESNNFFKNLDQLISDPTSNRKQAEKLDKLLVQSAKCAGTACRKRRRDWWSQKVTELRSQCHLL